MSTLEHHMRHQLEHAQSFFWHRLRWRAVASYLPEHQDFTLLDFGAGTGVLGEFLARERPRATYRFVEPMDFLEAHLEQRWGAAANARDAAAGADYVTVLDVMEHQEDDVAFLGEIVAEMKSGSLMLLTVPALQRLWSSWDVSLGHYRRYNKAMLRSVVAELPLQVVELSYLFPEMLAPALLRARRRPAAEPAEQPSEFPELPRPVNAGLYGVGRATLSVRRIVPAGTSLFAALLRR
jgi:2-polyprenyl-3-methyl-5-hydroxy-6-metoxy-1,4-benzoquinol methylase